MSRGLVRRDIVKHVISALVLLSVMLAAAPARAQDPRTELKNKQVPLRVQVVLSRYQGEKKISSMPYTMSVVTNAGKTSMRMGVDVPIPNTVFAPTPAEGKTASPPVTSYNYRSVGTNIDCSASLTEDAVYRLELAVQDSSVMMIDKEMGTAGKVNAPSVRHFQSSFSVLLRDGQTVQHIAATDPVSGEVLRVDVTLNLVK
jgi:hypothetical protein